MVARTLASCLPSPFLLANSNPLIAGVGSVFNLAGTMDDSIVGFMQQSVSPDDALELLPFYLDQAECILGETEKIMSISEKFIQFREREK
jgi:hypothetical protein